VRPEKAQVLTIYLGESDQWHGQPLYVAMLQLLREEGCAGATAMRAIAGYGASARLHASQGLRWSSDASIVIQVIDQPARIERLLPRLSAMLRGGLITLHETEVVHVTPPLLSGLPARRPVRQAMTTHLTTVEPETPLAQVLTLLLQAPFRALPVVDREQHLLGLITTGDLIRTGALPLRRGLVRTALALDETTAEQMRTPLTQAGQSARTAADVMNRQVRTVRPEQSLREAAHLMVETGLRRLPVVERDKRLVGMLSRTDLLRAAATSPLASEAEERESAPTGGVTRQANSSAASAPVRDYLRSEVATVHEDAPLTEVFEALLQSPLKRVVVIDDGQHVRGIISDVDLLASLQEELRPRLLSWLSGLARGREQHVSGASTSLGPQLHRAGRAGEVMNRTVVTVPATATVSEAIALMMRTGRKVLPVVDDDGRLVGIVGRSDLLRVLLEDGDDASY
jgi:CBS domain-containing protein